MIPTVRVRDLVMNTAKELGLPPQTSAIEGGATQSAAIHLNSSGVPTIVVAVPDRHIHSHSAILHRADYDNALKLLTAVVRKLDAATVDGLAR